MPFMGFFQKKTPLDRELYKFLKNVLGFKPRNISLYKLALLHKSASVSKSGMKLNNERLEYLGDAILSSIVADMLFRRYPYQGEGFLTEMRSKIVSRNNLNKVSQQMGISRLVRFSKESGISRSMDGDAFEALIGAMYLEKGYHFTQKVVVKRIINTYMNVDLLETTDWNYKSKLIDWGQKEKHKVSFEVARVLSYGHSKQYEIRVLIDNEPKETAINNSIKAAEQLAAEKTYKNMFGELSVNE